MKVVLLTTGSQDLLYYVLYVLYYIMYYIILCIVGPWAKEGRYNRGLVEGGLGSRLRLLLLLQSPARVRRACAHGYSQVAASSTHSLTSERPDDGA